MELSAGCQYDLYESKDAAQCLQGRWVVLAGSSNALLQRLGCVSHVPSSVRFNTLVNFLAPDEYNRDRHGEMIGIAAVVDVIVRNGKVTYWRTLPETNWACRQLSVPDAWKWLVLQFAVQTGVPRRHQACKQTYLKQLKRAPAVKDATRITFFTSYFWYRRARSPLSATLLQELLSAQGGGCRAEAAELAHRLRESDWRLVRQLHALEVPLLPQDWRRELRKLP